METKGPDFAAIPQTAIKVLTQPAAFFREMPKTGGFVEPLVFAAVLGTLSGVLQAVTSLLHLHPLGAAAAGLSAIFLVPIFTAIFSFIGAAIFFVIWKLAGSQENYETAYRCSAYLTALAPITALLGLIPYLGAVLSMAIMTYYIVMASVEAHKIEAHKAWKVFGALAVLLLAINLSGQYAARRFSSTMRQGLPGQSEEMKKQVEEMQKQIESMQKKP
ncbi:MAG: YIP1 family protein [Elusimicrobia bacterium]|nr:YIP1 family protein [Elusimicrobiota bacterium]